MFEVYLNGNLVGSFETREGADAAVEKQLGNPDALAALGRRFGMTPLVEIIDRDAGEIPSAERFVPTPPVEVLSPSVGVSYGGGRHPQVTMPVHSGEHAPAVLAAAQPFSPAMAVPSVTGAVHVHPSHGEPGVVTEHPMAPPLPQP
jgi:hypothetical protein